MAALLTSGLLGYWNGGRIPKEAIEHFRLYGTQWRTSLGERRPPETLLRNMPQLEGADQPVGSTTQLLINRTEDAVSNPSGDLGWLAQFYVRPNHFMFPDPTASALIGPLGLKLSAPKDLGQARIRTILFPDPDGAFAMAMVWGATEGSLDDAPAKAYDVISPILDDIAFKYDQPLPIAQSIIVGVPSGSILFSLPKPPPIGHLDSFVWTDDQSAAKLRNAISLYREGISSNNPFHQFLTLWKAFESADEARREWRRARFGSISDTRNDIIVTEEVIPVSFVAADDGGKKFGIVKERLRSLYRNAIAHGTNKHGRPKTGATSSDFNDVSNNVFLIRFMARAVIENTRACFNS